MKDLVYADYNAGAPVRPEAAEAAARALSLGGNPSSVHGVGRRAKALIETAREEVAASVGARPENVIFTSGATEALHLALAAAREAAGGVIVSAIEHDAVYEHATGAQTAPVTRDGALDLDAFETLLAGVNHPLTCVHFANNETGAIQPIAKAAARVREAGGLLLVDAAQGLGREEIDMVDLDASYLVLSSHKIGGPPGVGALILAPGAPFASTRFGGGQERGRRPGTENVAGIAGFGVAARIAAQTQGLEKARLGALRDAFEKALPRDAIVFAQEAPRLANTSLVSMAGVRAETAVIALDLDGVCVSSGSACSSGKVRASRVLAAMGVDVNVAKGALRFSFGWDTKEADVARCIEAVAKLAARAQTRVLEGAVS